MTTMDDEQPIDLTQPLVIEIKKKKKRKYSRGLEDMQVAGQRTSKIAARVIRSVSKGYDKFLEATDESALKRRDGALLDLDRNLAKGLSRSLKSASDIPLDLVEIWDTKKSRKARRRQTRVVARLLRILR